MDIALILETGVPGGDIGVLSDIGITSPGLTLDKDLQTAVIISLFTNRLAEPDDDIDDGDRQGWWADTYATVNGSRIGSRLWELRRTKQLQSVVNLAKQYTIEALQWLIEDQIAAAVEVEAEIVAMYTLGIGVKIFKPNATSVNFKFQYVWSQI